MRIIRYLSCKNPFCTIVKVLRFSKASKKQIPTAIREETTKRVNCHKIGNLPLFCIEKDTRGGVLYAPFACVLMAEKMGFEPMCPKPDNRISSAARYDHFDTFPSVTRILYTNSFIIANKIVRQKFFIDFFFARRYNVTVNNETNDSEIL